jgi:putative ABC transport system permease protein
MRNLAQIISTSVLQALHELRANKLRTFLSLLGITIGIFCIIAVFTMIDSMKNNIQDSMATLGSDVLYINRKPWTEEGGEYKWWEYLMRKPMSDRELEAIKKNINGVKYATICYADGVKIKSDKEELDGTVGYGVAPYFDKLQNIEVEQGRYLNAAELDGGAYATVIGYELAQNLFSTGIDPIGKSVTFMGRKFSIVGVMKKQGRNMAGFNYDRSVIYPFNTAKALTNTESLDWDNDPIIMVKAKSNTNVDDLKYEVEGLLRTMRRLKPGDKNDFSVNQLAAASAQLDVIFATINTIGAVIGGFSLIVGAFGIANIMFVTVKERTKYIGLKKAIGARPRSILTEFLVEAIALCIGGGLVGIVLVFGLTLLMTYGADFAITLSFKNFFLGISISGLVGVLAGFIPARAASRLDPVVAIRSN